MERLDRDVLIETALKLSLKDLSSLCVGNKRLHDLLCGNNDFWMRKLHREFPYTIGRFRNVTKDKNFYQDIYRKTLYAVFREPEFDKISKHLNIDWKKSLKYITFHMAYLYRISYFQFTLHFNFDFGDREKENQIEEEFSRFFFDDFLTAREKILRKYESQMVSESESESSEDEREREEREPEDIDFPNISGEDILNLFEPLLLNTLQENNILIADVKLQRGRKLLYIPVERDQEYEVDISSDT